MLESVPSALRRCNWPPIQPTAAITWPPPAPFASAGRTTTSVTMLAKKQAPVLVSPVQWTGYPAGVVGSATLTNDAPPSVER